MWNMYLLFTGKKLLCTRCTKSKTCKTKQRRVITPNIPKAHREYHGTNIAHRIQAQYIDFCPLAIESVVFTHDVSPPSYFRQL